MRVKTITTTLLSAFLILLTDSSCKKDDTNNTNSIVGKWKMTGYIHNGVDGYGTFVSPCVIDDLITFSNTNIVTVDEGLTKCSPTDPQVSSGTYSINSNQTEINTTFNGSTATDSILTLNSTTLKIKELSSNDIITHTRQ